MPVLNVLVYGVYSILGIFGLKLIFWDIPTRFDHYWKGVGIGLGGITAILALGYLYSYYFIIGVIVTILFAVSIFLLRSR